MLNKLFLKPYTKKALLVQDKGYVHIFPTQCNFTLHVTSSFSSRDFGLNLNIS